MYRNEYLMALARSFNDAEANRAIDAHQSMATLFVNARLPAWFYSVMTAIDLVALIKKLAAEPDGAPDVRPIGKGDCRRRAWTRAAVKAVVDDGGAEAAAACGPTGCGAVVRGTF